MRVIGGYQNTKPEDFAITPYLFGVYINGVIIKVFRLGLYWWFYSAYIGIGFGVPKDYPTFKNLTIKTKE